MSQKGTLKKAATIKNHHRGCDVGFDTNYFLPEGTPMHFIEKDDQKDGMRVSEKVANVFESQNAKIEALEKRNLYLEAKLKELIDLAEGAPLESGVCLCGDRVDEHTLAHGHNAVDIWDHCFERFQTSLAENQPPVVDHQLAYTDPESPNPLVDNKMHVVSGLRAGEAYNDLCQMLGGQYPDCRIQEEAPKAHAFFMALFGVKNKGIPGHE